MVADDEGPDAWCYDAVEPRTWEYPGFGQLTVLRSLELVWLRFDGSPAMFANLVDAEQAFEDFLIGPPAGPLDDAVAAEVRAYLRGARTPGPSTWLALELGPGLGVASWTLDGVNPEVCDLPGPASAGCYGGAPADTRRGVRALARPGKVEIRVRALAQAPHLMVEAALTLDVVAQQPRRLRVALIDGAAAPAIAVREVPRP